MDDGIEPTNFLNNLIRDDIFYTAKKKYWKF